MCWCFIHYWFVFLLDKSKNVGYKKSNRSTHWRNGTKYRCILYMKSQRNWAPASHSMLYAHMIRSSYTRKEPADTEVLTAVLLMARDFRDMTLWRRASCYRSFEGTILPNDGGHILRAYRHILEGMSSRKKAFSNHKKCVVCIRKDVT